MFYDWLRSIAIEIGYWCGFIYIPELDAAEYILPLDDDDDGDHPKEIRSATTPPPKPRQRVKTGPVEPGEWEEVEYGKEQDGGGLVIHYRNGEKKTTIARPPETNGEDPQTPPLLGEGGQKSPVFIDFDL